MEGKYSDAKETSQKQLAKSFEKIKNLDTLVDFPLDSFYLFEKEV